MSEYIISVDENDERWHYVEQQYTHFFGYPITDEIVRCRDCMYYDESTIDDEGEGESSYCYRWCEEWIRDDGYCAWGERGGDAE